MILVIGGLNGFIGSNTTEALVDLGQDCVVTRHKNTDVPGFLQKHIDHHRVFIEPADSTSIADLRKIGQKHQIEGIVNVAGGFASGEALCAVSEDTSTCSTPLSESPRNGKSNGSHSRVQEECTSGFRERWTKNILLLFRVCSLFLRIRRLSRWPQNSSQRRQG
ncbi:NAD-dependent epimerase/dehydratase family protein [Candidatus Bathyarchaeota archaeon]|nr:MAG: NAD-dependent epimerase/dehydratase family protein [Candidatus Bathyarchaeota archaeon]